MDNVCFYHMYCIGDCLIRFNTTLKRIKQTGLYDNLDKIYVNLVGSQSKDLFVNFPITDSKIVLHNISDETTGEMDTIKLLWDTCSQYVDNKNVLYLHSKGVSRPSCENVKAWIDYMEYFLIDKWKICLSEIVNHTTCGVNLQAEPMDHYSGNFWWAQSNYIKTLNRFDPQKSSYIRTPRSYCEFWLLDTKQNKQPKCLHSSNIDHYATYYERSKYETN